MAQNGIEVGCWKLENEKTPLKLELSMSTHVALLGVLALIPEHALHRRNIHDLVISDCEKGSSTMVSLKPIRTTVYEKERQAYVLDVRFCQSVVVGGLERQLVTILGSDNLSMVSPQVLEGGRKLFHPPNYMPDGAPRFKTQSDMLVEIEELCPITDAGIAVKMQEIPRAFVAQEAFDFEMLAKDSALTM